MLNTNRSPAAPSSVPFSRGPEVVVIDRFTGAEGWLSNSAAGPAVYEGVRYPTREHAYQAAKTDDLQERARIAAAATPVQAHRLGQTVTLRPGWDAHLRHTVMWQVLAWAFGNNPDLGDRLEATGTALLVDSTTDHDRHWAAGCRCPDHREIIGGNHLGSTLMAIRSVRRRDLPQTWNRVTVIGHGTMTAQQTAWTRQELRRVYTKLRREHGTVAVLTAAAGGVDVDAAELALQLGVPVWCYLSAPDHTAQLPRSLTYRQEQVRARAQRTAVLGTHPIQGRPGRAAELQTKVISWLVRDSDALIVLGDRHHPAARVHHAISTATAAARPVITIDPAACTVSIAEH